MKILELIVPFTSLGQAEVALRGAAITPTTWMTPNNENWSLITDW